MADDTYLMLGPDGTVAPVDLGPMMRRHRASVVDARAEAIDEVAGLFGELCLDPGDTWDSAVASGVSEGALDAAGNVTVELTKIEALADYFRPGGALP